ncbi:MAG: DUF4249 domain-containing protein [Bacteroidales bacterium]|nr:DUF4249 domain-containing protein [Bacteroidales bacterium]
MKIRAYFLFTLILIMVTACIDEFWPDLSDFENLLVVDGVLTSAPGPYYVRLSMTSDVEDPGYIPLTGCTVTIEDDAGSSELLTETEAGTYATAAEGIRGIVGRQYRILIYTPVGRTYSSPYQKLLAPVGIDSVYTEVAYHKTSDLYHDLAGLQFYVDTDRSETDTNYYLWQMEETYMFYSDFFIDYLYIDYFEQFNNRDSVHTCWRTQNVYEIFTASTLNLSDPILVKFPLHYVDTETRRLQVRYSLLVHQFTIDADAYSFYDQVKNLMTDEGTLYTKQPYQITGNVTNTDDPREPVLGYFLVGSVDAKRIFVKRPLGVPFYFEVCELNTDMLSLYSQPSNTWPIYVTTNAQGNRGYAAKPCFDCTLNGGVLEKPDFWQ